MSKKKQIIALVFNNPSIEKFVSENFPISHYEIKKFSNLDDFQRWSKGQALNGVFVDLKCAMKSSWDAKHLLNLLEPHMPICRLRADPSSQSVSGQIRSEFSHGTELVQLFIEKMNLPNAGRFVRQCDRVERFWNVEILNSDMDLSSKNFVTKDVSLGGLFLICAEKNIQVGQRLQLRILELEDLTPIEVEVKWDHPWGKLHSRIPGFGAEFIKISEEQKTKISSLLGISLHPISPEFFAKQFEP